MLSGRGTGKVVCRIHSGFPFPRSCDVFGLRFVSLVRRER